MYGALKDTHYLCCHQLCRGVKYRFFLSSITQTAHLEAMITMFFQCGDRVLLGRMLLFLYWMMVSFTFLSNNLHKF